MQDQDPTDPFAVDAGFTDAEMAGEDPFSGNAAVSATDYEEYEMPDTPIGVLPGFVKSAKKQPLEKNGVTTENLILEIECTDVSFSGAATISLWLKLRSGGKTDSKTMPRVMKICAALGLSAVAQGKQVRLPKPEAFVNRPGLFVYSTYIDKQSGAEQSTIAWGLPKPADSVRWNEWLEEANLSEDQLDKIKKSPGVLPLGSF
jgi:hypothetical protein